MNQESNTGSYRLKKDGVIRFGRVLPILPHEVLGTKLKEKSIARSLAHFKDPLSSEMYHSLGKPLIWQQKTWH